MFIQELCNLATCAHTAAFSTNELQFAYWPPYLISINVSSLQPRHVAYTTYAFPLEHKVI